MPAHPPPYCQQPRASPQSSSLLQRASLPLPSDCQHRPHASPPALLTAPHPGRCGRPQLCLSVCLLHAQTRKDTRDPQTERAASTRMLCACTPASQWPRVPFERRASQWPRAPLEGPHLRQCNPHDLRGRHARTCTHTRKTSENAHAHTHSSSLTRWHWRVQGSAIWKLKTSKHKLTWRRSPTYCLCV